MSNFTYMVADQESLTKIWDKNIKNNEGDERWRKWKDEYINNHAINRSATFLVLHDYDPIGEGTILWTPDCGAVAGRTRLADGHKVANINALRIEKQFEGQGHISKLVKAMEAYAKENGYERLTIGVAAREARNLAIYLHWGFSRFVLSEVEDNELVLYYEKWL